MRSVIWSFVQSLRASAAYPPGYLHIRSVAFNLLLFVVAGLLLSTVCADAAPLATATQGDMKLRILTNGHFVLTYKDMPILRDGSFHLAAADWSLLHPIAGQHVLKATVTQGPDARLVRLAAAENDICANTQIFQITTDSLAYDIEYEVKSDTAARFAVVDIFLNRDIVSGATFQGEAGPTADGARPASGALVVAKTGAIIPELRKVTLTTRIGEITLSVTSQVLEPLTDRNYWTLRNICDRPWGAEELRTFTVLHQMDSAPASGLKCRLSFSLRIQPAADLDTRIVVSGMEKGLRALRGNETAEALLSTLPTAPTARAKALQTTLEEACRQWQGEQTLSRSPTQPVIIPQPQQMDLGKGDFVVKPGVPILVPPNLSAREQTGVDTLVEELKDRFGIAASIRTATAPAQSAGAIVLGEPSRNPVAAAWLKRWKLVVTATSPGPEGYVLRSTPDGVVVAGSDPAGTFYGIQSLIQLLRRDSQGHVSVPEATLRDWPEMKWRGVHIWGLGSNATTDDLRRVIRRTAARYKMNCVMFGGSYRSFRWKSHPEITPPDTGITMEEFGQVAQYARDHFLEFIPAFQSFGHVEDLRAVHPEVAEVRPSSGKGSNSYCPSNPATYKLLFDLWQEVIEATKPRYFHAGHDEISHIGVCERCKGKSHGQLFSEDVTRLHDWLKERGAEMIIWGDMLLNREQWLVTGVGAAHGDTSTANPDGTDTAVDLIPKDVIIADWHYSSATDFPTVNHFMGKGLRVLGCPWYNNVNNYQIAQTVKKAGALGVIVTDWGFLMTLSAAATSILGPEYAWTPDKPPLDQLPYVPTRVLQDQFRPRRPSDAPGAVFTPLDIAAQANRRIACADYSDQTSWFAQGPGRDLWMLRGGRQKLQGMDFLIPANADSAGRCALLGPAGGTDLPAAVNTAIGQRADSLLVLTGMQSDQPSVWGGVVARLTVRYQDDTTDTLDLKEGFHVTDWRTYEPRENPWHWREGYADIYSAKPAFRGLTRFGENVNLQACEWVNPHPDKPIASLDLTVARKDSGFRLAILGVTAVTVSTGASAQ